MTRKLDCWEAKLCGRERGGARVDEFGVCPAATDTSADGLNNGTNGGRICWAVSGTFCGDQIQGTFAQKEISCMNCDFFKRVKDEEGSTMFVLMKPGQVYAPAKR